MVSKSFRVQVVVRISGILLLGFGSAYIIFFTHFWLVGIWTTLLMIVIIFSLIRFVERSNRELANFLLAIRQGDFTNTYASRSTTNKRLTEAFAEILSVFQKLSSERETNHLFLQTVVEHISIALITFDGKGEVININKAAKKLLNRPYLKNLDALQSYHQNLYQKLKSIGTEQGELIKILLNGELLNLSVRATNFILKDKQYKIVSLQDIKNELEEKEVESWQKLIRVLTHEIMNSAIPISTLSTVISQMLEDEEGKAIPISQLEAEAGQDILGGLKTIEHRSKGLVQFVEAYKSLTKIDPPKFRQINVKELVDEVGALLKADLDRAKITYRSRVDDSLTLQGDDQLLGQVLINIVKNAVEALEGQPSPKIELSAQILPSGKTGIAIRDNGPGISQDTLENIFVPFFSTKKKGSGIGLSLSRQIMRLHKGYITVSSDLGNGTVVSLTF